MEIKTLPVTIQQARAWYKTDILDLKELALSLFNKEKLEGKDYKTITTYYDALCALDLDDTITSMPFCDLLSINRAASAMFKLMIIRRALNLGQDLHLIKNPEDSYIYYPYNPFVTESSTYYEDDINSGRIEIIGKIKCKGEKYNVLGGYASSDGLAGFGSFDSRNGVGYASAYIGFLGCTNKEIAKHLGKYFGMLITEAKYGDLPDFEIVEDKYDNV